jgi:hypothetical protein
MMQLSLVLNVEMRVAPNLWTDATGVEYNGCKKKCLPLSFNMTNTDSDAVGVCAELRVIHCQIQTGVAVCATETEHVYSSTRSKRRAQQ